MDLSKITQTNLNRPKIIINFKKHVVFTYNTIVFTYIYFYFLLFHDFFFLLIYCPTTPKNNLLALRKKIIV